MSNGVGRRAFLVISISVLGIGGIGLFHSLRLSAYKDEAFYQSQYMSIEIEPTPQEASARFHELRKNQLTEKYKVQDYSLTIFSIGVVLLSLLMLGGNRITAFQSKKRIALLGICSALITSGASFFRLLLDFDRGEFPWWADSLGIPIFTQELPLLFGLVFWAIVHILFLRGKFECGTPLFRLDALKSNYWLSFVSLVSLVLVLEAIIRGDFMMVVPGALWIYFYLSLASGRVKKRLNPRREFTPA